MTAHWIDISVPLKSGMVHWPGDPGVLIKRVKDMERDGVNVSRIAMGAHTGTHMDAPAHFISGGKGIDQIPIPAIVGRARVIEIRNHQTIRPEELRSARIRRGERILLKTGNSARCWATPSFVRDFISLSIEAANFLAERKVSTVGIDYLSVGAFQGDGPETHRILLGAGIWIIEGLDLSKVEPGDYDLVCLPLKIDGGDGSPARAILKRIPAHK